MYKTKPLNFAVFILTVLSVLFIFIKEYRKSEEKINKERLDDKYKYSIDCVMSTYTNGYVDGRLNELTCKTLEEVKLQWEKDSAEFMQIITR